MYPSTHYTSTGSGKEGGTEGGEIKNCTSRLNDFGFLFFVRKHEEERKKENNLQTYVRTNVGMCVCTYITRRIIITSDMYG